MPDLFYCPDIQTPVSLLVDSEAHHAINVLRMKAGDAIRLFDGRGTTADGKIKSLNRREVTIAVRQTISHSPKREFKLTVAASPPKGDRLKWMIEKLTELGVDRFIPLQTSRTVVQPGGSKLKKLHATIISAAKQSGCLWLMEIAEPMALQTLLSTDDSEYYFAHPGTETSDKTLFSDTNRTVVIGPEGGFTDDEVEFAKSSGASFLAWPGSILRIETAAIVFAATALSGNGHDPCAESNHS